MSQTLNIPISASVVSAAPGETEGAAMDARGGRGSYLYAFVTGGSALVTLQGHYDSAGATPWVDITQITAVNGAPRQIVTDSFYPYIRGHYTSWAGATGTIILARGSW